MVIVFLLVLFLMLVSVLVLLCWSLVLLFSFVLGLRSFAIGLWLLAFRLWSLYRSIHLSASWSLAICVVLGMVFVASDDLVFIFLMVICLVQTLMSSRPPSSCVVLCFLVWLCLVLSDLVSSGLRLGLGLGLGSCYAYVVFIIFHILRCKNNSSLSLWRHRGRFSLLPFPFLSLPCLAWPYVVFSPCLWGLLVSSSHVSMLSVVGLASLLSVGLVSGLFAVLVVSLRLCVTFLFGTCLSLLLVSLSRVSFVACRIMPVYTFSCFIYVFLLFRLRLSLVSSYDCMDYDSLILPS